MTTERKLNERQTKFLDVLFTEAAGDYQVAKELAGYAENTNIYDVMKNLRAEIGEKLKESLGTIGSIKAYKNLLLVLDGRDDPLGRKERISVAKDILDRAGHKAADKVEIDSPNALFILPAKT